MEELGEELKALKSSCLCLLSAGLKMDATTAHGMGLNLSQLLIDHSPSVCSIPNHCIWTHRVGVLHLKYISIHTSHILKCSKTLVLVTTD